jgi:hypothetical protein
LLAQPPAARRDVPHHLRVGVLGRLDDGAVAAPAAVHRRGHRLGEPLAALLRAELAPQVQRHPLAHRVSARHLRRHLPQRALVAGQRHGEQQVVLGREVPVKRLQGHPRPLREVLHLHRFKPARGQHLGRRADHPVVPRLLGRRIRHRRQAF